MKVKMKRLVVEQEEEGESRRMLMLLEEEVREEDWLLSSLSIDSLFLLTAHNKLLIRGEERKEVCAASGPCILYRCKFSCHQEEERLIT